MISEKYIAGFLDADGSLGLAWSKVDRADSNPKMKRGYLSVSFSQITSQDKVIHLIQERIGGCISYRKEPEETRLRLTGKKAVAVLNRIKKYLVIKKHYANVLLDVCGGVYNRAEMNRYLKEQRKIRSLPLPNFPPRKWLAGYFDGDGCISVRLPKDRKSVQPTVGISASSFDTEGLEIIHKSFGGLLHDHEAKRSHLKRWLLTMPPSKAKQFLGYFAKHLINKREQAYFILGCAEMGHYRDGRTIKLALKQLKAQPHRLNESNICAAHYLKEVKDISFKDTYKGRDFWPESRKCKRQSKR